MAEIKTQKTGVTIDRHLGYLDSIRGIAAVIVLLFHCWIIGHEGAAQTLSGIHSMYDALLYCLEKLVEAGRSAVMIFFVLSGFVLAYSLQKKSLRYGAYFTRRVFRIMPAFWLMIVVSYCLHLVIGAHYNSVDIVLNEVSHIDLSAVALLKNLAMWGTKDAARINPVAWSLVHEMRISLLFPFIFMAVQRDAKLSLLVSGLLSVLCTIGLFIVSGQVVRGNEETSFLQTFAATGYFIVFFASGALLALRCDAVARTVGAWHLTVKAILLLMVILSFLKVDYGLYTLKSCIVDYMHGAAALTLISLMLGTVEFEQAMSHRILLWLGRVSYTLYLVHVPVLYVFTQMMPGLGFGTLTILVAVSSLLAAEILTRTIERPGMALGKFLNNQQKTA